MTTFYHLDLHDETKIQRVRTGTSSDLSVGSYIIRVDDEFILVSDPTNRADLVTKKYAAILASSAFFTDILFDPMFDASGIDLAHPALTGVTTGDKGVNGLYPQTIGQIPSLPSNLTILGSSPAQVMVRYEAFQYAEVDDKNNPHQRVYLPIAPDWPESPVLVWIEENLQIRRPREDGGPQKL